jgi:hypothetical protein
MNACCCRTMTLLGSVLFIMLQNMATIILSHFFWDGKEIATALAPLSDYHLFWI